MIRPVSQAAYSVIELLMVLAVTVVVAAISIPAFLELSSRLLVEMAAREVSTTLRMARHDAVRLSTKVGVKFRTDPEVGVTFAIYRDTDGDGVRSSDIRAGIDTPIRHPRPLSHMGKRIKFGFPPGLAPRDPSHPSRRLSRLHDPIRFNRSDIASFNSLGTATPGSIYITDSKNHLALVRVNHRAGKITVMMYDHSTETWE